MNINCLLCGVGGQGTVLAAKVLADAAVLEGNEVKTTETIGMAQRGGSVVSHVRIGEEIHSPLIPMHGADLLIGFEPAEAVRNLPYLKEGGTVVVCLKAVKPVTSSLSGTSYDGTEMIAYLKEHIEKLVIVDGEKICLECGSAKVLNVALLGAAAAAGVLLTGQESIEKALFSRLPEKVHDMNRRALAAGAAALHTKSEDFGKENG